MSAAGGGAQFVHSSVLGREIRTGPAAELGIPTDTLLLDAARLGDRAEAARLFDYGVAEADQLLTVMVTWLRSMFDFARRTTGTLEQAQQRLTGLVGPPPMEPRLSQERIDAVHATIATGDLEQIRDVVRDARAQQWTWHDTLCDWAWGMLTYFRDELGEARMEEVFRGTLEDWVSARYEKLPQLDQRQLFELTIEGMRGHFCGAGHSGEIEVIEDDEKWVLAFDPCGSGGRMRRGDAALAQQSRGEPPFSFGFTEAAHDWSWQEEDVCLYCAHCAVVNEILPIEQLGAPMRVTQYPKTPQDKCRWTIYKDRDQIPDWAYERVGKTRPGGSRDEA